MFKNIDIFNVRATQITFAFMLIIGIEHFFHIPHGVWFVTTSCMVFSAIHPGLVFKGAYLRLVGTLLGLGVIVLIWLVIHINFRFVIIILFFSMWALIFFIALPPNRYMVTIVMVSDLIIEWTNTNDFFFQYYVIDRIVCIILVFSVCIVIEYLWFGSKSMTALYYHYLCEKIRQDLDVFFRLAMSKNLNKSEIFRQIRALTEQLGQLTTLINDYTFEHGNNYRFIADAGVISNVLIQEFRKIICFIHLKEQGANPERMSAMRKEIEHSLNQPLSQLSGKRTT